MANLKLSLLIITCLIYCSCNQTHSNSSNPKAPINKNEVIVKKIIIVQPFDKFPISATHVVSNQLKDIFSGSIIIKKPIQLPIHTRNQYNTRYRADSLIHFLKTFTKKEQLIIGLTDYDISHTQKTNTGTVIDDDYGIMGLGYCPGSSCIASTFRLKGKNKYEKLFKVAIHELAHTQGLPHCPVKTCLMRDAEGKDHLDELKEFCKKCKSVLVKAGWDLN
ncbi:MAG: matrixin family metalloprotease [Bacteroidota bacterium]|jgi:archaemetzincin